MKVLKRVFFITFILLMIIVIGITGINLYVIGIANGAVISEKEAYDLDTDCIIVLGAAVRSDGTPSLMLQDRLNKGISIFENGSTDIMLMSGDNGTVEYNEVGAMEKYAVADGVPDNNIYLDHAGFSTYESMYRLNAVFQADSAIIVTQKYHLYRALYIGEKLGIKVYGVQADDVEYKGQIIRELREIFARVKDFYYVSTGKLPTYLGDPIPLTVKE